MEELNFPLLRLILAGAGVCLFGMLERVAAYRPPTVAKVGRWGTNIMLAAVNNFEAVLLACVQFHHSSIRVSLRFDAFWQWLFVPPAMHRIHHSVIAAERNSNYGAIFSFWDRIFGSFRRDVDQKAIRIGLPAYPEIRMVAFLRLWRMPFQTPGNRRSSH